MKILTDLSLWGIPYLGLNQKVLYISFESGNMDCSCPIMQVVNNLYYGKGFVFKASGLPGSINDIIQELGADLIHFHEGDAKKLYIRQFPECILTISSEKIPSIIANCWSNSITDRRRIYILDSNKTSELIDILDSNAYSDYGITEKTWEFIDAIIENVPDDSSNSFVLIFKKYLEADVYGLLNQVPNCLFEVLE